MHSTFIEKSMTSTNNPGGRPICVAGAHCGSWPRLDEGDLVNGGNGALFGFQAVARRI